MRVSELPRHGTSCPAPRPGFAHSRRRRRDSRLGRPGRSWRLEVERSSRRTTAAGATRAPLGRAQPRCRTVPSAQKLTTPSSERALSSAEQLLRSRCDDSTVSERRVSLTRDALRDARGVRRAPSARRPWSWHNVNRRALPHKGETAEQRDDPGKSLTREASGGSSLGDVLGRRRRGGRGGAEQRGEQEAHGECPKHSRAEGGRPAGSNQRRRAVNHSTARCRGGQARPGWPADGRPRDGAGAPARVSREPDTPAGTLRSSAGGATRQSRPLSQPRTAPSAAGSTPAGERRGIRVGPQFANWLWKPRSQ